MKLSQLKSNTEFASLMQQLAAERGLTVELDLTNTGWNRSAVLFRSNGEPFAAISLKLYTYRWYSSENNADPTIERIYVSGRFAERRKNRTLFAPREFQYNYSHRAELADAIEVLKSILRTETTEERLRRENEEALVRIGRRWEQPPYTLSLGDTNKLLIAMYRDGLLDDSGIGEHSEKYREILDEVVGSRYEGDETFPVTLRDKLEAESKAVDLQIGDSCVVDLVWAATNAERQILQREAA